jgi:hypothetical protein
MCAATPSMLRVVTEPMMAPLFMSMVKTALPVAAVVTAGVSCAPFRDAVFTTLLLPEPPESPPPHDDSTRLTKIAAMREPGRARMAFPSNGRAEWRPAARKHRPSRGYSARKFDAHRNNPRGEGRREARRARA